MHILGNVVGLEEARLAVFVGRRPVQVHLGRVLIQQGSVAVQFAQLALARQLAVPVQSDISTTTRKQSNPSDFSVSHRARSSKETRCSH